MRRIAVFVALVLAVPAGIAAAAPGATVTSARALAKIERRVTGAGDLGAFVSFSHPVRRADIERLRDAGVVKMHAFRLVPTVGLVAPLKTLRQIAEWPDVTAIRRNDPIRLDTDQSKKATQVDKVRRERPAGLGLTGKGVRVAVIDSGLDETHPDFEGRIHKLLNFEGAWIYDNPQDGRFTDRMAEATGPFAGVDEVGHGTHVAGTVLGSGAASDGPDHSGMAPGAELVVMKIASAAQGVVYDFGYEINAMIAIEYAVEHRKDLGIQLTSNSWSVFEVDDPLTEPLVLMVDAAVKKGLTMAFAAGNNGSADETVSWPGAWGKALTVAATVKTTPFSAAGFSSRGYQVDIAAPGVSIVAPRSKGIPLDVVTNDDSTGTNTPFYMAISGTSMATPHIAGIAALLYEAYPRITPQVVEEILQRTAIDLGEKGKDHSYGYGFVDAFRAGKVAVCLAKSKASRREGCFAAVRALPRGKWQSDFTDPGNKSKTSQGSDTPLG